MAMLWKRKLEIAICRDIYYFQSLIAQPFKWWPMIIFWSGSSYTIQLSLGEILSKFLLWNFFYGTYCCIFSCFGHFPIRIAWEYTYAHNFLIWMVTYEFYFIFGNTHDYSLSLAKMKKIGILEVPKKSCPRTSLM